MTKFARLLLCAVFAFAFVSQASAAGGASDDSVWKTDPKDWNVELYPVFVWAPFMGATVRLPQFPNLPDLPDLPNGPPGPSGNASSSLNGAAFFQIRVEKSKWAGEANILWAGLAASTTTPRVKINLDIVYGQAMGGREVLPNFWVEGGVRRMALNVRATLLDFPEVGRKPGITDPLVGLSYRRPLGRKFRLDLHADGGGFGVGSDVDYALTGRVDWRFAKHFGTSLGWGLLHLKISNTVLQRNLTISQTLNGPILGIGIYF